MAYASRTNASLKLLLAAVAAVGLAGCKKEAGREEYKADVVDKSGGQIIVEDATTEPEGVRLPETPMTNPPEETTPASGD